MGWSSSTKWGRKKTRNRGKVTWVDNSGAKPAPFMQDLPRYADVPTITEELEKSLTPGTMFSSLAILGVPDLAYGKTNNRKYQTLERWWYAESAIVAPGQFLIYAGIVRIDERESNGRIVSVPRHTFIFGSGRYVINDFSLIQSVL